MIKFLKQHGIQILTISLAFWACFIYLKNDKINVADDDLGYLLLKDCIKNGEGFTECFTVEKRIHRHYDPGLPYLMAGFSKFISSDIQDFKYLNGILLLLYTLGIYLFFSQMKLPKFLPWLAALFLVVNTHYIRLGIGFASEPLFFIFQLLAIYGIFKLQFTKPWYKNTWFIVAVLAAVASFHVRNVGLFLAMGAFLTLWIQRQRIYAVGYGLIFFILSAPWAIISRLGWGQAINSVGEKTPGGPVNELVLSDRAVQFWQNFKIYFLHNFQELVLTSAAPSAGNAAGVWIISFALLSLIIVGFIRTKHVQTLIGVYAICTLGLLLVWTVFTPGYGTRYLTPLLPFVYLYVLVGFKLLLDATKQKHIGLSIALAILGLAGTAKALEQLKATTNEEYSDFVKSEISAGEFIQEKYPQDILFGKCCPLVAYTSGSTYIARDLHFKEGFVDSLIKYDVKLVVTNSADSLYSASLEKHFPDNRILSIDTVYSTNEIGVLRLDY